MYFVYENDRVIGVVSTETVSPTQHQRQWRDMMHDGDIYSVTTAKPKFIDLILSVLGPSA